MANFGILSLLAASNFDSVGDLLESFLNEWWGPLLGVVSAAAGVLAIAAGIKYIMARANGDEQKVKQARNFVIGILIGIAIMFLLAAGIPVIIAAFQSWYGEQEVSLALLAVL